MLVNASALPRHVLRLEQLFLPLSPLSTIILLNFWVQLVETTHSSPSNGSDDDFAARVHSIPRHGMDAYYYDMAEENREEMKESEREENVFVHYKNVSTCVCVCTEGLEKKAKWSNSQLAGWSWAS